MNKKYLMFGIVGLFAMVLISAGAVYFNVFSATFNVTPAITVGGELAQTLGPIVGGQAIVGTEITLTGNGDSAMEVLITDNSDENVEVSYIGELQLTKKTVDFNLDVWVIPGDADKVQIEYTVVGDEFNAEVIADNGDMDYILIYYADNDDRFANPGQAVLVEDVSENLPGVDDENAVNDYSAEYPSTPFGAKIWYVPMDAIPGGVIDWNRADEFYFESSLIQYNAEGQITVYPTEVLDFTPEYTPNVYASGDYTITTTVA